MITMQQPVEISWTMPVDYDRTPTPSYSLYCDDILTREFAMGEVVATIPDGTFPDYEINYKAVVDLQGRHNCYILARNANGEARSVLFSIQTPIKKPKNLFIDAVKPNEAFLIKFDADDISKFRLWCDGRIVKNYSTAEVKLGKNPIVTAEGLFTYTLSAPALTQANHSCLVSAFDSLSELKSDPLNIIVECLLVIKK